MNEKIQQYINMQKSYYIDSTQNMSLEECKTIIGHKGSFDIQGLRNVQEYFLEKEDYSKLVALDFGCGVGRLMEAFLHRFSCIDGVDLSPVFLRFASQNQYLHKSIFYQCNGYDLCDIPNYYYDMVYSVAVLEHICVHEIRYNYFKEFYRILKHNGQILIQMQGGNNYAPNSPGVDWYDNYYEASGTNYQCDVKITNLFDVTKDLNSIGYRFIYYKVIPVSERELIEFSPPRYSGHQFHIVINAIK